MTLLSSLGWLCSLPTPGAGWRMQMLHHQEMMPSPSKYNQNIKNDILKFTLLYSFSVTRVLGLFLNFSWFRKGSALSEQTNESLLRMRMYVSKTQRPEGETIEG
jgi:hypothetical protein